MSKLNDYKNMQLISSGGMGEVYRAINKSGQNVAIKKIKTEQRGDHQLYDFFISEASILSAMNHPNIIKVYDLFHEDGDIYLVQEYFAGYTLKYYKENISRPANIDDVIKIFTQILDALEYAHGKGIVHKDLKPANILIDNSLNVKLIDFGIASNLTQLNISTSYTKAGTKNYGSPEQFNSQQADHRSDIYSLGIVLWEVLTGANLIRDETTKLYYSENHLPDPRRHHPFLSKHISNIIKIATNKIPAKRFQSAYEFKKQLNTKSDPDEITCSFIKKEISVSVGYVSGLFASVLSNEKFEKSFRESANFVFNISAASQTVQPNEIYEHIVANLHNFIYRGVPTFPPIIVDLILLKLYGYEELSELSDDINKSLSQFTQQKTELSSILSKISKGNIPFDNHFMRIPRDVGMYHALLIELIKAGCLNFHQTQWDFSFKSDDDISQIAWIIAIQSFYHLIKTFLGIFDVEHPLKIRVSGISKSIQEKFGAIYFLDFLNSFDNLKDVIEVYPDNKTASSIQTNYVTISNSSNISQLVYLNRPPFQFEFINQFQEESLKNLLTDIFRKKNFREGQLKIIKRALSCKNTIGLLPTGHGKSLCYQLLNFVQPCALIIIDPLKSLMIDQAYNLTKYGIRQCAFISSDQQASEKRNVMANFRRLNVKMLFVSPERFQSEEFRQELKDFSNQHCIGYGVIDEAHCVSEWGHDFRTSYLVLTRTLKTYCNHKGFIPTIYALTGTASEAVLDDIVFELDIRNDEKREAIIRNVSFDRSELSFKVIKCRSSEKFEYLNSTIKEIANYFGYGFSPRNLFNLEPKVLPGLIFAPHIGKTEFSVVELSEKLANFYLFERVGEEKSSKTEIGPKCPRCDTFLQRRKNRKTGDYFWGCPNFFINSCRYTQEYTGHEIVGYDYKIKHYDKVRIYGGKSPEGFEKEKWDKYKLKAQNDFITDQVPLLISTKSFGMGIDKPNIRYIIHYNLAQSIESYYQEAGRAGRDKQKAYCYIIFSDDDPVDANKRLDPVYTADEVWEFSKNTFEGDVHRMLFFQKESFKGKKTEETNLMKIYDQISHHLGKLEYAASLRMSLPFDIDSTMNQTTIEKAIYRLCQVGFIDDYTLDYQNGCFAITVRKKTEDQYASATHNYIATRSKQFLQKYPSSYNFLQDLKNSGKIIIRGCISELISFVYRTIEPQRRRALWNLLDAARSDYPSEFRRKMLHYMNSNEELAELIDEISESDSYEKWINLLNQSIKNGFNEQLLGMILRKLESYPEDIALLYISACLRTCIKDENLELAVNDLLAALRFSEEYLNEDDTMSTFEAILEWINHNCGNELRLEALFSKLISSSRNTRVLISIIHWTNNVETFIQLYPHFLNFATDKVDQFVTSFNERYGDYNGKSFT